MYLHTNTPPQLILCNNLNCTNRMKGQTYNKEQKLAIDCYRCAENIITDPKYNSPMVQNKKENGRLKEEIFVNKTVSMKVEQDLPVVIK